MKFIHSLAVLSALGLVAVGCSRSDSAKPVTTAKSEAPVKEAPAPHLHGAGPNGGVIFDLGSHHAEFTVDHAKQACAIVILGPDEKTPAAVKADEFVFVTKQTKTVDGKTVPPMTIAMKPTDAAEGKATKFVGTDPGLANVAEFAGTLTGEIDGKPATGEFSE